MPATEITVFDPGGAGDGSGFCALIQTDTGADAPAATVVTESGERLPISVVSVDPSRGLWSAYLEDGISVGEGYLEVKAGGCINTRATPTDS